MIDTSEIKQFEKLVQAMTPQSKLIRAWGLKGGVSAQVTALEIEHPDGQLQKMIVRQHGEGDRRKNPQIAEDEFKLLQFLQSADLPVPTPYYVDSGGEIFSTPCIVIEFVEGETDFAPANLEDFILQFTTQLARIHSVSDAADDLVFLPHHAKRLDAQFKQRPAQVDESLDEGRIRAVLEAAWPFPQHNPTVLLHGDYWPGNVIWKEGNLAAIIDWEDAALGDPLADFAYSRLEILWTFGNDAMERFSRHYQAMTTIDFTNLPYWDLCAALRPAFTIAEWASDKISEKRMREFHKIFITQAFDALSVL
ncbi:MAG: phosphotransferase [Chitinophagaceae bacterium]|nr:phosphotransferase [Anaerolineae bacterium]